MSYNHPRYYSALRQHSDVERFKRAWAPSTSVAHGVQNDSSLPDPKDKDINQNRNPLFNTPFVCDPTETGYVVGQRFPGIRSSTVYAYVQPDNGSLVYQYGELERSAI